jgi:hypothetical protein
MTKKGISMSFRSKLILLVTMPIVMMLATFWIATSSQLHLSQSNSDFYQKYFKANEAAHVIKLNTVIINDSIKGLLRAENEAQMNQLINSIVLNEEKIYHKIQNLKGSLGDENEWVTGFGNVIKGWQPIYGQVLELLKKDEREQALLFWQEQGQQYFDKVSIQIDDIIKQSENNSAFSYQKAQGESKKFLQTFIILAAITLLLALFIAVILIQWPSRKLLALQFKFKNSMNGINNEVLRPIMPTSLIEEDELPLEQMTEFNSAQLEQHLDHLESVLGTARKNLAAFIKSFYDLVEGQSQQDDFMGSYQERVNDLIENQKESQQIMTNIQHSYQAISEALFLLNMAISKSFIDKDEINSIAEKLQLIVSRYAQRMQDMEKLQAASRGLIAVDECADMKEKLHSMINTAKEQAFLCQKDINSLHQESLDLVLMKEEAELLKSKLEAAHEFKTVAREEVLKVKDESKLFMAKANENLGELDNKLQDFYLLEKELDSLVDGPRELH